MATNKKIVLNKFNAGSIKQELISRTDSPIYNSTNQYSQNFIFNTSGQIKFRNGFKFEYPNLQYRKARYISWNEYIVAITDQGIQLFTHPYPELELDHTREDTFYPTVNFNAETGDVVVNGDNTSTVTLKSVSGYYTGWTFANNIKVGDEVFIKNSNSTLPSMSANTRAFTEEGRISYTIKALSAANSTITVDTTNKPPIAANSNITNVRGILTLNFISRENYTYEEIEQISYVKVENLVVANDIVASGILLVHPKYLPTLIAFMDPTVEPALYKLYKTNFSGNSAYPAKTTDDFITRLLASLFPKTYKRGEGSLDWWKNLTDIREKPSATALYNGRLYFVRHNYIWASTPGAEGSFNYGDGLSIGTNSAFVFKISNANRDEPHEFYWLQGTNKALYAGSKYGVVQFTGSTVDAPISIQSFQAIPVGNTTCANTDPIHYLDYVIYITGDHQSLMLMDYSEYGQWSFNVNITENTDLFQRKKAKSISVLYKSDFEYIAVVTETDEVIIGLVKPNQDVGLVGSWALWSLPPLFKITSVFADKLLNHLASIEINGKSYLHSFTVSESLNPEWDYPLLTRQEYNQYKTNHNKHNLFLDGGIFFNSFFESVNIVLDEKLTVAGDTLTSSKAIFDETWKECMVALSASPNTTQGQYLFGSIPLDSAIHLSYKLQPVEIVNSTTLKFVVMSANAPPDRTWEKYRWALGVKTITELPYTDVDVSVMFFNGDYAETKVTNYSITLDEFLFAGWIGMKYIGRLVTIPVGSLDDKKGFAEVRFQLLNSHGFSLGTDFDTMEDIPMTQNLKVSGQPVVPFTGNTGVRIRNMDYFRNRGIHILHNRPNALNILHIGVYYQDN